MTGDVALRALSRTLRPRSRILDVGAGKGEHSRRFADAGHEVVALDLLPLAEPHRHVRSVLADLAEPWPDYGAFDVVWCSHVLEHLPDVGRALAEMRRALSSAGLLAVTVPPRKDAIVSGHVNLFNLGLLAYRLILAGFDCRRGSFGQYGYNLSAIVRRDQEVPARSLAGLRHDAGDIELLETYFPGLWPVCQGFDGSALPDCGLFAKESTCPSSATRTALFSSPDCA